MFRLKNVRLAKERFVSLLTIFTESGKAKKSFAVFYLPFAQLPNEANFETIASLPRLPFFFYFHQAILFLIIKNVIRLIRGLPVLFLLLICNPVKLGFRQMEVVQQRVGVLPNVNGS